jgi:hypothetical protein
MPDVRRGRRRRPRAEWRKESVPASVVQLALIAFIVLKLTGVIGWSWWWVLSPLWISGILLVLAVCGLLIGLRWRARRLARSWMDPGRAEWLREFAAGRADLDAFPGNHGPRDGSAE